MVTSPTACTLCQQPLGRDKILFDNQFYCCHACKEVAVLLKEEPWQGKKSHDPAKSPEEITLGIEGLWCTSCARLLTERLKRTTGIANVKVSYLERKARIDYDSTQTDPLAIIKKIRRIGYRAVSQEHDLEEEDRFFTRMLVGGLLAMHIMVVGLIIYIRDWLGLLSPETAWMVHFFHLMQFVLSIPLTLILGFPILKAGLNSLRFGVPNVQSLVAIGSIAALVISAHNLFLERGAVYFDTAAMLFFLLTIGRWLELKVHQTGKSSLENLTADLPSFARAVTPAGEATLKLDQVKPGMRLRILPGEQIPADGVIASGRTSVDESLLTGESRPNNRKTEEKVYAGTHCLDGTIEILTTRTGDQTRAGQIQDVLENLIWQRSPAEKLADQLAAWMVYGAFGIAVLTFTGHYIVNGLEAALLNSLSVLLIACPCALGIATPITLWQALAKASENGVLLRNSSVLEKLVRVKKIYFDKTGTLTERKHMVSDILTSAETDHETFIEFVAALERLSRHPFGEAIIEHTTHLVRQNLSVQDFKVVPGAGLSGIVAEHLVFVGSQELMRLNQLKIDESLEDKAAELTRNGQIVIYAGWEHEVRGIITIGEQLRSSAKGVLKKLRGNGYAPEILTGDSAAAGERWSRQLDIKVHAGLMPEEKLAIIEQPGIASMMIGDGINDGPALAAAEIGIALVRGADVARTAAEVTLMQDDLRAIPWLLELSRATNAKLRQNLAWAVVYNLAGIGLAVAGLLQPVIAALAMVISSTIVTRNALHLRTFPPLKTQTATSLPPNHTQTIDSKPAHGTP